MLLGDILSEIERTGVAGDIATVLNDFVLLARMNEAAAVRSIDSESYALAAVRDFERSATPEDWATLISAVTAAADPSAACLTRMIERSLIK